jgi:ABC-type branched-subunit amino acid transport system ATPase component
VRTLQRTVILGELDARTEVAIGARARDRERFLGLRELLNTPGSRAAARRRLESVSAALAVVDLSERGDVASAQLDSAEQRLLQIARAVATGADWLLLDEPAAGMSATQRRRLVDVVRRLASAGRGILLVEHDMALVGSVADRVTVLAEGRVLARGTVAEIRRDPAVARAYLGDHAP